MPALVDGKPAGAFNRGGGGQNRRRRKDEDVDDDDGAGKCRKSVKQVKIGDRHPVPTDVTAWLISTSRRTSGTGGASC